MSNRLHVRPGLCNGCRSCEIACSFVHSPAMNRPALSRVKVFSASGRSVPTLCLQCESAACVTACPAGALRRNPATLSIEVDDAACLRCQNCVSACPFGNIHFDSPLNAIVKCDLCQGEPACVRYCPTGALTAT